MFPMLRTMLLAAVPLAAFGLAPDYADAAHWQQHNGYWYYYDDHGRWNYHDGRDWYRYRDGRWHYHDRWNRGYYRQDGRRYRAHRPYYGRRGYNNRYYGGRGFGIRTPWGGFRYFRR